MSDIRDRQQAMVERKESERAVEFMQLDSIRSRLEQAFKSKTVLVSFMGETIEMYNPSTDQLEEILKFAEVFESVDTVDSATSAMRQIPVMLSELCVEESLDVGFWKSSPFTACTQVMRSLIESVKTNEEEQEKEIQTFR